mmetsp:Transcript_25546/g.87511  ORF Transcript_25546/g.87511 Transcript_25546/m.87511 type:complete len:193 (-) Transcript_25546:562-1140(-)
MVAADTNPEDVKRNKFLARTGEREDLNQYWYSAYTIEMMAKEVEQHATKAAFLSTPSIYFSLQNKELMQNSWLFDLDEQWAKLPTFVKYDFQKPEENIPKEIYGTFDYVVIDPPFITRECWELFAKTAKLLLREGGKVLLSTVWENADMLKEVIGVERRAFQPSIPHLVYQYSIYTNYETELMDQKNPEIPE